jgi:hypothetical protein
LPEQPQIRFSRSRIQKKMKKSFNAQLIHGNLEDVEASPSPALQKEVLVVG